MTVATSLIPGLGEIIRNGDSKRRAEALRRIADLFFEDATKLRPHHIEMFDEILLELVVHAELIARAELAERLSPFANAPRVLVGRLAREDEILVAGPVLRRSPVLGEEDLLEIARLKGQGHLLAMSERRALSPDLTDVIVSRGDREVVRRTAGNHGAIFSESGYGELIRRAAQDGVLTLAVGQRDDLSDRRLKQLLAGSLDVIRRRLFDIVKPSGILYLSWRVTDNADDRDAKGRLYAAFDPALVLAELKPAAVLLDEEAVSASSGKKIHRLVVKKPGLEIRE